MSGREIALADGARYQLFPELSDDLYQELKSDIRERGIMVPLEYDNDGNLLDGHHRLRAWEELGREGYPLPPPPSIVRDGWTEAEKRTHVRRLNILRRHLSQEQRRDLIRDQLRETPERSSRQVATTLGVSPTTVATVRSDMEASGDVSKLDTSADTLGRQQPVHKPASVRHAPTHEFGDDYVEDVSQDADADDAPTPSRQELREQAETDSPPAPLVSISPEERARLDELAEQRARKREEHEARCRGTRHLIESLHMLWLILRRPSAEILDELVPEASRDLQEPLFIEHVWSVPGLHGLARDVDALADEMATREEG